MAVTLAEYAIEVGPQMSGLERAVIKMFAQKSPILKDLPMVKIDGNAWTYRRETNLPSVGWRAVNQAWTESSGTINPLTERLMILGGEVKIDNFIVDTQPNQAPNTKALQYALKVQAAANEFDRAFLEGDDLVDTNVMVGLRRRLAGSQVLLAGAGGATLTLAMLDQLIDLVPFDNKRIYLSRTARRKTTSLVNASGGSSMITYGQDEFGRQNTMYGGIPLYIIETMGDASTVLDYDEDPGDGVSDTASIYCVSLGEDRVHGIYNGPNGKVLKVQDFGEQQSEPRHLGRIEAYYGMVIEHPRAAARLRGVTNT